MKSKQIFLFPENNYALQNLCGPLDENIKYIESKLKVKIQRQNFNFSILSQDKARNIQVSNFIRDLYKDLLDDEYSNFNLVDLARIMQENFIVKSESFNKRNLNEVSSTIKTANYTLNLRGDNQLNYIRSIKNFDITFGIGPAGTGKTFLAVAAAVEALEKKEVKRILLVRPAIEAGEKLGFLPGDISQKVDPYLRPLYDSLFEMLGVEKVESYIKRSIIEIAPLAYMRGRTLNDCFIILDESQNTTIEQMKMFLTRIGFNSKTVITGDISQIDLPRGVKSGLKNAIEVLSSIDEIGMHYFIKEDIVRHPIIMKIVESYENFEKVKRDEKCD
ncbi:MAG: PhoH family protein [Psittacicella sp.]